MPGIEIVDAQSDMEFLMDLRAKNRAARPVGPLASGPSVSAAIDPKLMKIAMAGMDKDEGTFAVEEQLETQKHLWSDKYRPRKPTYMNRVQTGFEWNKYNQTHYDQDNPPPKIVQAYKFNVSGLVFFSKSSNLFGSGESTKRLNSIFLEFWFFSTF